MNTKNGYCISQVLSKRSNAYLLTHEKTNILFDSGFKTEGDTLISNLKKVKIDRIDTLILTHAHHDHAGNAAKVKEHFDCQVLAHRSCAEYLHRGDSPPVIGTRPSIRFLMKLFGSFINPKLKYEPCSADILLDDSNDLKTSDLNVNILYTPGHTKCSISIIIDNEAAIVGDTLFGASGKRLMPPFAVDTVQIKNSWKKLIDTKCSVFFPGHGKPVDLSRLQSEVQ